MPNLVLSPEFIEACKTEHGVKITIGDLYSFYKINEYGKLMYRHEENLQWEYSVSFNEHLNSTFEILKK